MSRTSQERRDSVSQLQRDVVAELRRIMRRDRVSQSELARELNVSSQYINGILLDQYTISLTRLVSVVDALGYRITFTIDDERK